MIGKLDSYDAWKAAKELARTAYSLSVREPLCKHRVLADQLQRAAVSVPANIIEGYALGTKAQFIRCTRISLASAAELKLHVWLIHDVGALPSDVAKSLRDQCDRVISLLVGLLKSLGARGP